MTTAAACGQHLRLVLSRNAVPPTARPLWCLPASLIHLSCGSLEIQDLPVLFTHVNFGTISVSFFFHFANGTKPERECKYSC